MARSEGQKKKLILLARFLESETDETHGVTLPQMLQMLEREHIRAERKSIYNDLEALRELGWDIVSRKANRECYYSLASRPFELAELKLLVDAVQSSKFLPVKKSRALIKKLEGLCSRYDAQSLQRQVYVANRVKAMNESIYYSIDTLHEALGRAKQVSFLYSEWTAEKKLRYRHGGRRYFVSPYALVWEDENYYLIAYDAAARAIRHYRVDKMSAIECEDLAREGREAFEAVDLGQYTRGMFGMFGGETTSLTLSFSERLAGVVIDRFGKDVIFLPREGGRFAVHLDLVVSPQFMGWLAGLGPEAKIEAPSEVAQAFCEHCRALVRAYADEQTP